MNISLTPELKEYVAAKVASGMYHSASEVMGDALRALMAQEHAQEWMLEELQREVATGIDQPDRGEFDRTPPQTSSLTRLGGRAAPSWLSASHEQISRLSRGSRRRVGDLGSHCGGQRRRRGPGRRED